MSVNIFGLGPERTYSLGHIPSVNNGAPRMLTRSYSVPCVHTHSGAIGRYRPTLPVYTYTPYKSYWPYRNYRGYTLADAYWYDQYYYFSPLYKRSMFPIQYKHSDYKSNPYYWNYPHTYWMYPYKGKWYDYDCPSNYRPFLSPNQANFPRQYRYRSHVIGPLSAIAGGNIAKRFWTSEAGL